MGGPSRRFNQHHQGGYTWQQQQEWQNNQGSQEAWDEEDNESYEEEDDSEEQDFYAILKIKKDANVDRIRSAFLKRATSRKAPKPDDPSLRRVCIAFLVLKDADRRQIYDDCGYKGLRQSESYCENSVFDEDPDDVVSKFFSGQREEDREWMLLNGNQHVSESEEEWEEEANGEDDWAEEEDAEEQEALAAMAEMAKAAPPRCAQRDAEEADALDSMLKLVQAGQFEKAQQISTKLKVNDEHADSDDSLVDKNKNTTAKNSSDDNNIASQEGFFTKIVNWFSPMDLSQEKEESPEPKRGLKRKPDDDNVDLEPSWLQAPFTRMRRAFYTTIQ